MTTPPMPRPQVLAYVERLRLAGLIDVQRPVEAKEPEHKVTKRSARRISRHEIMNHWK